MRSGALRLVRALPNPVLMAVTFGADANPAPNLVQGAADGIDWTNLKIVNHVLMGTQAGNNAGTSGPPYDDGAGLFINPNGQPWPPDQDVIATCVITDVGTSGPTYREVEIRLRSAIGPHVNSGYEVNFRCTQDGSQYAEIVRWNSALNSYLLLKEAVSPPGIINGYQVRATMIGSVIAAYQRANAGAGWTTVATYDTATGNDGGTGSNPGGPDTIRFTTGAPGVGTWIRGNTDASKAGFSDALVKAA